ncbi:MAG: O-antigen ligase family protein [Candidatus Omnitrophota bacterium]
MIRRLNKENLILICDRIIEYSLYILIFFLPISKSIIEICASLAILVFIVKKIITKKFLSSSYLNESIFLYLAVCILSIIFSTNTNMSLKAFFAKLLENVLIYFIVFEAINNKKKNYIIFIILFSSAALICIDGIFQYFTHIDFLRHRNWHYSPMPFTLRITGPFITSNDFAAYLAPLSILTISLFFSKLKKLFIRIFLKILATLLLICLFLTLSRGAWLGIFFGLIFIGFFINKRSFIHILAVIIIVFALLWQFLPQEKRDVISTRFTLSDPGGSDRRALNKISWDMWSDSPIFGLGLGTYMYNFEKFNYDIKSYPWGPSYAHNCYLQILVETGLFGLLSFLFLTFVLFFKSTRKIMKLKAGFDKDLSAGILAALLVYLVHSAFDTNLYNLDIGLLFWFLLGLSQSQLKILEKNSEGQ